MTPARALTLLWFLLTLVALAWPAAELPRIGLAGIDKVVHASMFALGTVLALRGWPEHQVRVIVALLIFAPLAEVWQGLLPTGRDANTFDVLANVAGIAIGWLLMRVRPVRD